MYRLFTSAGQKRNGKMGIKDDVHLTGISRKDWRLTGLTLIPTIIFREYPISMGAAN